MMSVSSPMAMLCHREEKGPSCFVGPQVWFEQQPVFSLILNIMGGYRVPSPHFITQHMDGISWETPYFTDCPLSRLVNILSM